jgi:hypothetical protein
MSYEGYVVYYCENGHRVDMLDSYEAFSASAPVCKICGTPAVHRDYVDQTNGCTCSQLPEKHRPCPCHEKELKQLGWDSFECNYCKGSGIVESHIHHYAPVDCECKGEDPACRKCFGTGQKHEPASWGHNTDCAYCKGTGKLWEERFDISPLRKGK